MFLFEPVCRSLLAHKSDPIRTVKNGLFANPEKDRPYHQDPNQQEPYPKKSRVDDGLGDGDRLAHVPVVTGLADDTGGPR